MAPMTATNPRVSFADLERWPEDGRRYELYDGEVYEVPSPFPLHQIASARLHLALAEYVRDHGGIVLYAPLDIVLTEYDVVQPDVVFFRESRRHVIDMMAATRAAPDLAVEVLSRSTAVRDRGRKMQMLARYRVPEYWIVDPVGNTIEIYSLAGDSYRSAGTYAEGDDVESPTLPGLRFPASLIFEE